MPWLVTGAWLLLPRSFAGPGRAHCPGPPCVSIAYRPYLGGGDRCRRPARPPIRAESPTRSLDLTWAAFWPSWPSRVPELRACRSRSLQLRTNPWLQGASRLAIHTEELAELLHLSERPGVRGVSGTHHAGEVTADDLGIRVLGAEHPLEDREQQSKLVTRPCGISRHRRPLS